MATIAFKNGETKDIDDESALRMKMMLEGVLQTENWKQVQYLTMVESVDVKDTALRRNLAANKTLHKFTGEKDAKDSGHNTQ